MSAQSFSKKNFFLFLLLLLFYFSINFSLKVHASVTAGYVQDCKNENDCVTLYGKNPEDWLCVSSVCVENRQSKYWFEPQSLIEFQKEYYGLPEEEVSDQRFSVRIFSNLINSANLSLIGKTSVGQSGVSYLPSGGAISLASNLIASLFLKPPASGIDYLADLGKNLGIPSVYAQTGIGAKGLQPILPLWNAFKNMAYVFYILIFIFTGLMIMFRKKISPQAVITIENALPGIIVSLIAVTFSYAIAGFLIDIVYVLINLTVVVSGISGLVKIDEIGYVQNIFINNGFSEVISSIFGLVLRDGALLSILGGGIVGTISGLSASLVSLSITGLGAGIGVLVLGCLIVVVLFKLFLSLLSAYISVIINIILSPILLMMSALPGSKSGGIGKWITDLLSDLLIFPAIAGYLIIAKGITDNINLNNLWGPPLLASSGQFGSIFSFLVSFGLLLYINKIPETVKKLFDEKYKKGPNLLAEQAGWLPGTAQNIYNFAREKGVGPLEYLRDKEKIGAAISKEQAEGTAKAILGGAFRAP